MRRGIYLVVPTVGSSAGKIINVGEAYMSKVDSVAPNPFTAGNAHDITVANIHPGMPGLSRTDVLTQGLTPQIAGPMTIGALTDGTIGNGYLEAPFPISELMVFQGSMFVMKKDAADTFATNVLNGGTDTHMRLVEFFDSGAMQGEEIMGGNVPGTALEMKNFPSNFIGFVRDQINTVTPSFSGTLNFLARTIYASSYAEFGNAYTSGTLSITAPTTTTAGSATLVMTPAGGGYADIIWPIGGTKALYAVSASATGTVSEVGEAYITQ